MIQIGKAAKYLRERLGLSQRAAAAELGISHVHLNKIENGNTSPTANMIERYFAEWGVDLYMVAVTHFSDESRVPSALRKAVSDLSEVWEEEIDAAIARRKERIQSYAWNSEGRDSC